MWLEAFNSNDRTKISAFWHQYGGTHADEHVEGDLGLRDMTGGMTIFRVVEDTDKHLVVLMKEGRDAWSESTLDLDSTNPPVIGRIGGHPVPAPDDAASRASNDADLVDRIEKRITASSAADSFSGAILVAHNGHILLEKAVGLADTEHKIPNSVDTQFCIGSMNKMFTAIAILQLVQEGKLTLDQPMVAWWPTYPNRDLASRVTIRQLLSHSGGTGDIFTPEYEARRLQVRSLSDYVGLYGSRPVAFEPGSKMEYSNYGFILLGRLIELVSGESYDSYVHQHIFVPAGMLHTDSRPEVDHVAGRAVGYMSKSNVLVSNANTMPWSGTSAGGGYSTVHDLFLFARALEDGTLLHADLFRQAIQPSRTRADYGLGFYVLPEGGYGHGGGTPGINAELHILPRSGYIVVALANRDPRMASDLVDFVSNTLPKPSLKMQGT